MQGRLHFQVRQWAGFNCRSHLPLHRRLEQSRSAKTRGIEPHHKPSRVRRWRTSRITALADSGSESILTVAGRKGSALLYSRHDKDIFNLAVPALFSILLDPLMSLTDTGRTISCSLRLESWPCYVMRAFFMTHLPPFNLGISHRHALKVLFPLLLDLNLDS